MTMHENGIGLRHGNQVGTVATGPLITCLKVVTHAVDTYFDATVIFRNFIAKLK